MEDNKEIEEVEETEEVQNEDIDIAALADLVKEKDEQLLEMQKEIDSLKRSNASLLVRVNAGEEKSEKTFEENLFDLVGQPTER